MSVVTTAPLSGDKVTLRFMTDDDTAMIVEWRNRPFVRNNMINRDLFTDEGHREWIRTMIDTGKVIQFIILLTDSLRPIGSAYLRDIDYTHNKAEFGIFIGEDDAHGQGYGTQTALLVSDYALSQLSLHKVYLRFIAGNRAAEASYEKAGFRREAYLVDDVKPDPHGSYCDIVLMARIKET
jgi:RimJ/RimL family protein N-acetyltransferase